MNKIAFDIANRLYYLSSFLITIWVIGLAAFYILIPKLQEDYPKDIDAIVILTGGSLRLDTGFEAFSKTNAKKMLISGVGKGVQKKDILNHLKNTYDVDMENITLGEFAKSTDDNAIEAKIFMDLNKYKSMLLVTSNYHMPRSAFLFWVAMPELMIQPLSVDNPTNPEDYRLKLILTEYNKFLGSLFLYIYNQASDIYIESIFKIASSWSGMLYPH
ncbi:MAG: YdcF family protein [Gammaproteobacteria bacterium]